MTQRLSMRGMKKAAAVASVGLLAAVAACGGGSDSGDGTIVIGYSAGLSGGGAEYGVDGQNGLKMAIDEINEEGGEVEGKK